MTVAFDWWLLAGLVAGWIGGGIAVGMRKRESPAPLARRIGVRLVGASFGVAAVALISALAGLVRAR
jgi:hypothetical protein